MVSPELPSLIGMFLTSFWQRPPLADGRSSPSRNRREQAGSYPGPFQLTLFYSAALTFANNSCTLQCRLLSFHQPQPLSAPG